MNGIVSNLRLNYGDEIQKLSGPRSLFVSLFILLKLFVLGAIFISFSESFQSYWLTAAVVFFIGSLMRAFGNVIHECAHDSFSSSRTFNYWLGTVLCICEFSSFTRYRREHLSHHLHLGDLEKDLDLKSRFQFFSQSPLKQFLLPFTFVHLKIYLKPIFWNQSEKKSLKVLRITYLALLIVTFYFFPTELSLYFILPYISTYQIFRFWSDAADHAGINQREEEFYRARNHVLPILGWIFFPRHDEYHLVHHLFPKLPTQALKRGHHILLGDNHYACRLHTLF